MKAIIVLILELQLLSRVLCQNNISAACLRGYYGRAWGSMAYNCDRLCPCPNGGACMQLADNTVECLECPAGYAGPRCDLCSDGFYGDPTGRQTGFAEPCKPCDCNNNVDENAFGNCDQTTGMCLKCKHHTGGERCDECLLGYYGNALMLPHGECKQCACDHYGTDNIDDGPPTCDQSIGQCWCKPHVTGRNCDICEIGYYDLTSGTGCHDCDCDPIGSMGSACDANTGQCQCRPGVAGKRCDSCAPLHYGFSSTGCTTCDCDEVGSQSLQCDASGRCLCNQNVEGTKCNSCKENAHDRKRGCIDCTPCYNLIREALEEHREQLSRLEQILSNVTSNPNIVNSTDFDEKLAEIRQHVDKLSNDTNDVMSDEDKPISQELSELKDRLRKLEDQIKQIDELAQAARMTTNAGDQDFKVAKQTIVAATKELNDALDFLENNGTIELENAKIHSQNLGYDSQELSILASDAEQLAKSIEKDNDDSKNFAKHALDVYLEAYKVGEGIEKDQNNTRKIIAELSSAVGSSKQRLGATLKLAKEALQRTEQVREDALTTKNYVINAALPDIDIDKLRNESMHVIKESERIIRESKDFQTGHYAIIKTDIEANIFSARNLISQATNKTKYIDALVAEANAAKAAASNAVDLSDKTLTEAEKTWQILLGYNGNMNSALQAVKLAQQHNITQILSDIEKAENKIVNATTELSGINDQKKNVKLTLEEAQNQAEQSNKVALSIIAKANHTKAFENERETANITQRISETEKHLVLLGKQASAKTDRIETAKGHVIQAESDVNEALQQVEKALKDVKEIMRDLQALPDINEQNIENLEYKLDNAEQTIDSAKIDQTIDELRDIQKKQKIWIDDRKHEFGRLQLEIASVQAIAESLPNNCYKRVNLEPS